MIRFFFETERFAIRIEFDHTIMLRIAHRICKDLRAIFQRRGAAQIIPQAGAEENIIAENQTAESPPIKSFPMMKASARPTRLRLCRIGKRSSPFLSVAEQTLERRQAFGRADHQDFPNTRQHQHRKRIINHRLVIDRQDLFAHAERQRIKTRAASARKNDLSSAPPRVIMFKPIAEAFLFHDRFNPVHVIEIPLHRSRKPVSMSCIGIHPNSFCIFVMSIA